jgi:hypothetical protein
MQKVVTCLPHLTPKYTPFASCSRCCTLNGTRVRANALLTRLDVPFNLAADGDP